MSVLEKAYVVLDAGLKVLALYTGDNAAEKAQEHADTTPAKVPLQAMNLEAFISLVARLAFQDGLKRGRMLAGIAGIAPKERAN